MRCVEKVNRKAEMRGRVMEILKDVGKIYVQELMEEVIGVVDGKE